MSVVIDESLQKAPLTATPAELKRMLQIIKEEIFPVTVQGVTDGNKVFGAAILDKEFVTTCVETNRETTCPLFHGEVHAIYQWSKMVEPSQRGPLAQSANFLATHEPCCMCVSSILWSGFQKVFYFFPYSVTTAQGIPHDVRTMHELWGVPTYRKQNRYLSTACIMDLIEALPEGSEKEELLNLQNDLSAEYDRLSNKYHTEKVDNKDNSLVLA
jgi:tRNA(Arg) A34 adenosine deaminase TadA